MSALLAPGIAAPDATTLPRLVPSPPATTLGAHLDRFGPLPVAPGAILVDQVARAGLRGRGGAAFPTATKLDAVRRRTGGRSLLGRSRAGVVVANGTEGEPASKKDVTLLALAPHLVIDGTLAAARAVGADRILLCVDRSSARAVRAVGQALADRPPLDDLVIELVTTPTRYVVGEESALVHFLNGGDAKPTMVPPRPFERGVGGAPTLLSNVETFAHIALIARFGGDWWKAVGTPVDPGSALFSVGGGVDRPGVYELPLGVRLDAVLRHAGTRPAAGVLLGGYFGTWLSPSTADSIRLAGTDLAHVGASIGCGVIAVVPASSCPLAEVARVTAWLAGQSAGQCGPCVFGLPAISAALQTVVAGERTGRAEASLRRWLPMVNGRGACKLPDAVYRFVGSALNVFDAHLAEHRRAGACGLDTRPVLPVPHEDGPWR
jgi:NADH:ubiquinone oxidoreductase subunit F (NADH-binding)